MKTQQFHFYQFLITLLCCGMLAVGCAGDRPMSDYTPPPPTTNPETLKNIERLLSGPWDYEDRFTIFPKTVLLDKHGNGPYDFKDGYLFTLNLTDHVWEGWWYQRENDREGGFEIILSEDFTLGKGHWWYTRIGEDTEPTAPGEKFQLTRTQDESAPHYSKSRESTQSANR